MLSPSKHAITYTSSEMIISRSMLMKCPSWFLWTVPLINH